VYVPLAGELSFRGNAVRKSNNFLVSVLAAVLLEVKKAKDSDVPIAFQSL
jgi:hypothetical protein